LVRLWVSSFAVTAALFIGCSNSSSPSTPNSAGSNGDSGGSGNGGGSGGSAGSLGASGEAGGPESSGGSSATNGVAGEAGSTESSGGSFMSGGTGGGGSGGDATGGTGGDSTGGTGGSDSTGGTGGSDSTGGTGGGAMGGSGGSGGKGSTPSPNVGCMGTVTSDANHRLTSCGFSVSKMSGQAQFTLALQGKDANNDGLTLTLQFTDVPTAMTYTFESTDYMAYNSTWNQGSTIYTATAYDGIAGLGSLFVQFDTVDGPFTLASTTFYVVTGNITGTLNNPPSGIAMLELTF
jgi:hypothetical protein